MGRQAKGLIDSVLKPHMSAKQIVCQAGELIAGRYLESALNWQVLHRNLRFGVSPEIDIVALDGKTIVFVEVKTRIIHGFKPDWHEEPSQSISRLKQIKIKRAARLYLQSEHLSRCQNFGQTGSECRFDVILIGLPPYLLYSFDSVREDYAVLGSPQCEAYADVLLKQINNSPDNVLLIHSRDAF